MFTDDSHSLFSSEEGDRSILSTEISVDNALAQIPEQQIAMLQNVKALLDRLDEQCVKNKELLFKERERTANLQAQIDAHAYRRIHALPMGVQRGCFLNLFVCSLIVVLMEVVCRRIN